MDKMADDNGLLFPVVFMRSVWENIKNETPPPLKKKRGLPVASWMAKKKGGSYTNCSGDVPNPIKMEANNNPGFEPSVNSRRPSAGLRGHFKKKKLASEYRAYRIELLFKNCVSRDAKETYFPLAHGHSIKDASQSRRSHQESCRDTRVYLTVRLALVPQIWYKEF